MQIQVDILPILFQLSLFQYENSAWLCEQTENTGRKKEGKEKILHPLSSEKGV